MLTCPVCGQPVPGYATMRRNAFIYLNEPRSTVVHDLQDGLILSHQQDRQSRPAISGAYPVDPGHR